MAGTNINLSQYLESVDRLMQLTTEKGTGIYEDMLDVFVRGTKDIEEIDPSAANDIMKFLDEIAYEVEDAADVAQELDDLNSIRTGAIYRTPKERQEETRQGRRKSIEGIIPEMAKAFEDHLVETGLRAKMEAQKDEEFKRGGGTWVRRSKK